MLILAKTEAQGSELAMSVYLSVNAADEIYLGKN